MQIREYLGYAWEDLKAWRRGERRVAPRGTRGRVYAKKPETGGSAVFRIRKEPVATLTMRVTRADGSIEVIKVPAQVK